MEIKSYIIEKRELYEIFLDFIESRDELAFFNYEHLEDIIDTQKIYENPMELRLLLHLLVEISKNHYRDSLFNGKIEKIILFLERDIKQTFTNSEIFNIFQSNKLILLFLVSKEIISIDEFISLIIDQNDHSYFSFFYPEIKNFLDEKTKEEIETNLEINNFEEKRKIGENDSYICELIRNDLINEFIIYLNQSNLSISKTKIKPSIFETNSFLLKKQSISLIEYAAFFGSIQIFQYLKMNNALLEPSLWLYAVHGRNAEMIHLLEENHVEPEDETFEEVFKESIKCHHNDIAIYIQNNLLDPDVEQDNIEINFDENVLSYCFHYYNYSFFPNDFNNKFIFYYACQYDYFRIVEFLLKNKRIRINDRLIRI